LSRVKYFFPIEFELFILEKKMEIGEPFFKKKHAKLAHGRNLAPKIFPAQIFSAPKIIQERELQELTGKP
jgi:hypothetical protein